MVRQCYSFTNMEEGGGVNLNLAWHTRVCTMPSQQAYIRSKELLEISMIAVNTAVTGLSNKVVEIKFPSHIFKAKSGFI